MNMICISHTRWRTYELTQASDLCPYQHQGPVTHTLTHTHRMIVSITLEVQLLQLSRSNK